MKKPLIVKIVEALGWTYVALAVLMLFYAVIAVASEPINPLDRILICLCCLAPLVVSVGMLVSLRHGRNEWFLVPNTVLLALLSAGLALDLLEHTSLGLAVAGVASLILVVVPLILLCLPSSVQWFKEKRKDTAGANGCLSSLFVCAAIFTALALLAMMCTPARGRMIDGRRHVISVQSRDLFWCMANNFCEKAAVIVDVGGAAKVVENKYSRPDRIFPNGIPKPGPETYFLTPTGRVDLVERKASVSP